MDAVACIRGGFWMRGSGAQVKVMHVGCEIRLEAAKLAGVSLEAKHSHGISMIQRGAIQGNLKIILEEKNVTGILEGGSFQ